MASMPSVVADAPSRSVCRLVHEFAQHSAPVSGLAMHPTEFLMASASVDRTLRLWDLESFDQVCCMPPDSGQIRRVVFSEDGSALVSGAEESLRVWGWEPVRCYEQTDVRWSRLTDLCISPGQHKLLAGSVREAIVAVWNVDMKAMKPFASAGEPGAQPVLSPRPAATSPVTRRQLTSEATPPRTAQAPCHPASEPAPIHAQAPARDPSRPTGNADEAVRQQIAKCRAQLAQRRATQGPDTPDACSARPSATAPSDAPPSTGVPVAAACTAKSEAFSASGNHASVGTSMTNTLSGSSATALPNGGLPPTAPPARRAIPASAQDQDVLVLLTQGTERQEACLHSRLDALRALHAFWQAGEVKKVGSADPPLALFDYVSERLHYGLQMLQHLQQLDDPSVTHDMLAAGIVQGGRIDLECALVLLPLLRSLLDSSIDDIALTAMHALSHLSLTFGPLIKNTRAVAQDMLGGEYKPFL